MENQIEIYKSANNAIELQVYLDNDTFWLNRHQLAMLFDRDIKTIGKHINTIFEEQELEDSREIKREIEHYKNI
jgi:hypothetical protein